ncbi:hypothetical protein N0V82_005719 [Gnomoniopsis sp. IMI 355080]|nr:hypothetical protein N0V82_005719 [Gnomoniopsis sp. IMI 355080]
MTDAEMMAEIGQKQPNPTIFTTTRHPYNLQEGEELEICIQSFDPRFISDPNPSPQPWILGINVTVYIETGQDDALRPSAGNLGGFLIKRELIPQAEDEFLRRMMSMNSHTQQLALQLFDAQGRLKDKFKGRGIRGSENDDSWIFEVSMAEIHPGWRREGVGRKMIECVRDEVLAWAREAQREVLMVLMLGAPKRVVDEHMLSQPLSSAADIQQVSTNARLRAKRFWRSLGFRRLSERSNWFGWTRFGAEDRDHSLTTQEDWESEDEIVKLEIHDDDMAPDVAEKWVRYQPN